MTAQLSQMLDKLMHRVGEAELSTEWDEDWPSPCQIGEPDSLGRIRWQPIVQSIKPDWSAMEAALEIRLHDDVKRFFASYYSDNLRFVLPRGTVDLLFAWNAEDMLRLQQNLVGHVLMKKRLGQATTLFIASTDDDDFLLSVDNASGQVCLEQVGCEPKEILAATLADFIALLLEQGQFVNA